MHFLETLVTTLVGLAVSTWAFQPLGPTAAQVGRVAFGPNLSHSKYTRVHSPPGRWAANHVVTLHKAESLALEFIHHVTGIPVAQLAILSSHTQPHSNTTHVYVRQSLDGLVIENAHANINVDRLGRIISYGESLHRPTKQSLAFIPSLFNAQPDSLRKSWANPSISPVDAVMSLLTRLDRISPSSADHVRSSLLASFVHVDSVSAWTFPPIPRISASPVPVKLSYLQVGTGSLKLVYAMSVEADSGLASWVEACVCASTGRVESVTDWAADSDTPPEQSSYRVFPIGVNDPSDGERKLVSRTSMNTQSPSGWVSKWSSSGNNVVAEDNSKNSDLKHSSHHKATSPKHSRVFDFPIDFTKEPATYLDASITQMFYTVNSLHDIFYAYGFTETAGNFQLDNLGHGGAPSDPVIAYAQDGSGYNNANFVTPPDGHNGKMRMYVWNTIEPNRDGDLENGIVIHEFGHGVSTRLTGGRMNSGCLGWGEAGGMGEGWSDMWSVMLRMRTAEMANRNFGVWEMGKYSNGGKKGIRKFPYSTDLNVNPSTYSILNKNGYWGVHAKGEVWAMILLEVYWNLVEDLGFTDEWTSARFDRGNTLMMQLLVDGIQMQPCRPTFLDARDAMFHAEMVLTAGIHACSMWRGFAKRGLGADAKLTPAKESWRDDVRVDGFAVPDSCKHIV